MGEGVLVVCGLVHVFVCVWRCDVYVYVYVCVYVWCATALGRLDAGMTG